MTGRRVATFIVGILISAAFLWIAARNADFVRVLGHLSEINPLAALPYVGILLLFFWARTYRWRLLLSPISSISTRSLFGPMMIGYAANFLLPFQMGEIVRTAATRNKTNLEFVTIASTIVVERVLDYLLIMTAFGIALLMHEQLPDTIRNVAVAAAFVVMGLVVLTMVLSIRSAYAEQIASRLFFWLPNRFRAMLQRQFELIARGFQSVRRPDLLFRAALWTVLQWMLLAFCIWIALTSVGLVSSLSTVMLIMVLLVLAISVPNAPAYLGSVQAAYVISVEAAGGDPAQALSASIFHHVLFGTLSLLAGMIALSRSRLSVNSLRRTDQSN